MANYTATPRHAYVIQSLAVTNNIIYYPANFIRIFNDVILGYNFSVTRPINNCYITLKTYSARMKTNIFNVLLRDSNSAIVNDESIVNKFRQQK